jgi:hypothetical protein
LLLVERASDVFALYSVDGEKQYAALTDVSVLVFIRADMA